MPSIESLRKIISDVQRVNHDEEEECQQFPLNSRSSEWSHERRTSAEEMPPRQFDEDLRARPSEQRRREDEWKPTYQGKVLDGWNKDEYSGEAVYGGGRGVGDYPDQSRRRPEWEEAAPQDSHRRQSEWEATEESMPPPNSAWRPVDGSAEGGGEESERKRSSSKREVQDQDGRSPSEKKKKRKKNREERRHEYDDREVQPSSYPPPDADGRAIPGMGWEDETRVDDDEQRRRERRRRRIRQEEEAEAEGGRQRQLSPQVDEGLERVLPSKPAEEEEADDVDDEEFEKFLSANNDEKEEGEEGEYEEEDEQDMAFAAYLSNFKGKEESGGGKKRQEQQQHQRRYDPKPGRSPREEYERHAEQRSTQSRRREERDPEGEIAYSQFERGREDPRYSEPTQPRAKPQIFEYGEEEDVDPDIKTAPDYSQHPQEEGTSQYSSRYGEGGQYAAAGEGQNHYGNYPSEERREQRY